MRRPKAWTAWLLMLPWLLFALTPPLATLLTSIKQPVDAFAVPPVWLFTPTFAAYKQLWVDEGFSLYLWNSAIVALATVAVSLVLGASAGYALARYRKTGGFTLLMVALLFRALPRTAFALPFYWIARATGLYDTRLILVLVLVAVNQPFTVWMFRGFFLEIPEEIDEAAMVDGCTRWGAFRRVILPLAMPGAITAGLFTLLLAYNEFLMPVVLTATRATTLPVAISAFGTEDLRYWTITAAGSVSIALPIVVVVLICQRYFVRGLAFGAVKG